ncbi:hypothetical protein B0H12DRAFT_1328165 [Mycena haematopus]|nr:hypothetical protein B0H12DRAFT_1328165 [Mycena haematopus]
MSTDEHCVLTDTTNAMPPSSHAVAIGGYVTRMHFPAFVTTIVSFFHNDVYRSDIFLTGKSSNLGVTSITQSPSSPFVGRLTTAKSRQCAVPPTVRSSPRADGPTAARTAPSHPRAPPTQISNELRTTPAPACLPAFAEPEPSLPMLSYASRTRSLPSLKVPCLLRGLYGHG